MLLSLIELAGNKALEFDQASLARLEKLRGKTMTLHIKNLDRSITVCPRAEGLEFSSNKPEQVDVTLSTTLSAMIKISREGLDNAELEPGELDMSGDPIVGQRFAQVIADLNIDWQGLLSEQIGAAPAKTIVHLSGQAKTLAEEARSRLHTYVQHLIQEEMELAVGQKQVDQFLDDVDSLRANVDRLSARINRLKQRVEKP